MLVARGLGDPETAAHFLQDALADLPDPFLMRGMRPAVERLLRAVCTQELVTLYGDYDVDGVCSTALMSLFLEACGASVATSIPHRIRDGYGLNRAAAERIAQDGSRVLVTLDCGITAAAEVGRARDLGLDVVVVDHHTVPATLPPALAVLNPHQEGCGYPTRHLCAAGVAFMLCMGLRRALREAGHFQTRPEPNLKALLDLVALATVADVVPLTGANRVLVKHGLVALSRAERPGVRALKEAAGLKPEELVTAGLVGFRLGPRINAAGRLDDAALGLRLLRAASLEEARPLAHALDVANQERQLIEHRILGAALVQAESQAGARGLVLWGEDWHAGVVGIVAARVVERVHRPTVVVAVEAGVGKGSARSIERFHLVEALDSCAAHLLRYGGHRAAAGVTVEAKQSRGLPGGLWPGGPQPPHPGGLGAALQGGRAGGAGRAHRARGDGPLRPRALRPGKPGARPRRARPVGAHPGAGQQARRRGPPQAVSPGGTAAGRHWLRHGGARG